MSELLDLVRLFRHEQTDPAAFYTRLADLAVQSLPSPLRGSLVIDVGSGPGYYTERLTREGADVIAVDFSARELANATVPPARAVAADAKDLPIASGSVDGVFTSNMLEHVRDPAPVLKEIERVLKPGAWAWISWTTWLSPWGGHELSPFHYLGGRAAVAIYRRRTGVDPKHVPGQNLFPTSITAIEREIHARSDLRIVSVVPRYFPRQRWILRIRGLREILSWNCLIVVEHT